MVQPAAARSDALLPVDYLWPLTSIRDNLLSPLTDPSLILSKLSQLLQWHIPQLQHPSSPFSPSSSKRPSITGQTLTIPRTNLKLDIDETARTLALHLAERAQIDEVDAYMIAASYKLHAVDSGGEEEEAVWAWYSEEVIAVCEVVMALDRASREDWGEWSDLAEGVRREVLGDEEKFIEGLFRGWCGVAQKEYTGVQTQDQIRQWSIHQLKHQDIVLSLLFQTLYNHPTRSPAISEGLIRGTISSGFGTSQLNRDLLDDDPECQRLQARIRDQTLLIALESICLTSLVELPQEDDEDMYEDTRGNGTILKSKEGIMGVTMFLADKTQDLAIQLGEVERTGLSGWPIAVICLAWAIVLRSTPEEMQPSSAGLQESPFVEFAGRALRLRSGLFPWLEWILSGPLLVGGGSDGEGVDMARRKVIKDLLIGLSENLDIDAVADRSGLYRVWGLVMGGGSSHSSTVICQDYFTADFAVPQRRAIVEKARFPYDSTSLPTLLAALTGSSSGVVSERLQHESGPAGSVVAYLGDLPGLTHAIPVGCYRVSGKDAQGRLLVQAIKDIILPGSITISSGTRGLIIRDVDGENRIVTWESRVPSWSLLVEILRSCAGMRRMEERDQHAPEGGDFVCLSVGDLGISGQPETSLSAGLGLLRSVLHPTLGVAPSVLASIQVSDESPAVRLLLLMLGVLDGTRHDARKADETITIYALDIIRHLTAIPDSHIWTVLRNSSFFGSPTRKRRSGPTLIQVNSSKGDHGVVLAILKLIKSIITSTTNPTTPKPDESTLRAAIHLTISEVWSQHLGWRYNDLTTKCEISAALLDIFDGVLRHPLRSDGTAPSVIAESLMDVFIMSANVFTYRPLLEAFTQSPLQAKRLLAAGRKDDAKLILRSVEAALSFLPTLLRISHGLGISAVSLPKSFMVTLTPERIQLVDALFSLAASPATQTSLRIKTMKTLRTYLEAISGDTQRPSLAGLLTDTETSLNGIASVARLEHTADIRSAAWLLLSSIISTQPGCTGFATASPSESAISGILEQAVTQIIADDLTTSPQASSSALRYIQSVLDSPSTGKPISALRIQTDFWLSVYDIATRPVPSPPTFTLSMHSDDFASRIQHYAYSTLAKATAISILATELSLSSVEGAEETKTHVLLVGLFRNVSNLMELAGSAGGSNCLPGLHEKEQGKLDGYGVELPGLRTIVLGNEREYGLEYLYDGNPSIPNDRIAQSTVNLALDMLNLNWSMLDADLALTRSFTYLCEVLSPILEGDGLASPASLRAGVTMAEMISQEDKVGDVILQIQAERLQILAILLESGLERDADTAQIKELGLWIRGILENPSFAPGIGLRNQAAPAVYKPILRMILLLLQVISPSSNHLANESLIEACTAYTLDSADVVLDTILRQRGTEVDIEAIVVFGQVVGIITEISRTQTTTSTWLDKISEHNLIARTLELVTRIRLVEGYLPPHIPLVLDLHLALASHPTSAEKLAISGVLPAYSDNAIALQAESGAIEIVGGTPNAHTIHGAWVGMLLVLKALLVTLPAGSRSSFIKSDVVPFMRVCTPQITGAMYWDTEDGLTKAGLKEMSIVYDIFWGIVSAVGTSGDVLSDYSGHALSLLSAVRGVLEKPITLGGLFRASTEEEQVGLEKECGEGGEGELRLLDFGKTPFFAKRVVGVLEVVRVVLGTLVVLTKAWGVVQGEEGGSGDVLRFDEQPRVSSDDPVGILHDFCTLTTTLLGQLPTTSKSMEIASTRRLVSQINDASLLLATAQLVTRRPEPVQDGRRDGKADNPDGMDVDQKRRASVGVGEGNDERRMFGELRDDLKGLLGGDEGLGVGGGEGFKGWIGGRAGRLLFRVEEE